MIRPEIIIWAGQSLEELRFWIPMGLRQTAGEIIAIDGKISRPTGGRRPIAENITDAAGDGLLALETDQPAPHDDARWFYDPAHEPGQLDDHQSVDGGHGRIAVLFVALGSRAMWPG